MKPPTLYICYHTLTDPLVQTQVIGYLRGLAGQGYPINLLTFEREPLPRNVREEIERELTAAGISWSSLRYHRTSWLPVKLYDLLRGAFGALWIALTKRVRLVHGRSHVGAAMAMPLKALLRCRLLFDIRGLLADEYVDGGHWRAGGLNYRLTKWVERLLLRWSDGLVVLTERIKKEFIEQGGLASRASDIQVIPCCVDTNRFSLNVEARSRYRAERGWSDRLVLSYVGKLGTWYLTEEMTAFFACVRGKDSRFFLQVLTQSDPELMRQPLQHAGIPATAYDIRFAPPEQLAAVLAASDVGLSFIKPCPSKRASSPTKVAEYLAAGLPVVANTGIGDYDAILRNQRIGVLLDGFTPKDHEEAAQRLRVLLEDPTLRSRCRTYAAEELSMSEVGVPRYAGVYDRLLGTHSRNGSR